MAYTLMILIIKVYAVFLFTWTKSQSLSLHKNSMAVAIIWGKIEKFEKNKKSTCIYITHDI